VPDATVLRDIGKRDRSAEPSGAKTVNRACTATTESMCTTCGSKQIKGGTDSTKRSQTQLARVPFRQAKNSPMQISQLALRFQSRFFLAIMHRVPDSAGRDECAEGSGKEVGRKKIRRPSLRVSRGLPRTIHVTHCYSYYFYYCSNHDTNVFTNEVTACLQLPFPLGSQKF